MKRGLHVLVTAGPTREHIDPVRYLTNESSGRMGFELAAAARRAGHSVTLVSGPVHLPTPPGVERLQLAVAELQRPGAETVRRALGFVRASRGKPFFLFVHLFEPHATLLRRGDGALFKTGTFSGVRTLAGYADTSEHGRVRFVISLKSGGPMRFQLLKAIEAGL